VPEIGNSLFREVIVAGYRIGFLLADAERVKDEVQKQAKDFGWQRVNGRLTFGSTPFRKVHQSVESYESR
jgi:hypothetical protein